MASASIGPSVLRVAWSIVTSLVSVRPPAPAGSGSVDHSYLEAVLSHLEPEAVGRVPRMYSLLADYLRSMEEIDPDGLSAAEALAFWMNVYNAAALRLAATTIRAGLPTVLRVPGGFHRPVVSVAGEELSLDDIEHGKVRRFKDPRVHAGLVCGSVSCPSLPRAPFGGEVDRQLEDRMIRFLGDGALRLDPGEGLVTLSPIFSWFGGDFTRSGRMPTLVPARRRNVLRALTVWMDEEAVDWVTHARPRVIWGHYDWRLGCSVG